MKYVRQKLSFLENSSVTIDCHPMTIDCTSANFKQKNHTDKRLHLGINRLLGF